MSALFWVVTAEVGWGVPQARDAAEHSVGKPTPV